ncbi:hypothetical protein [Pontibacter sp. G13]|uniref:hypothetical protein n=1 Tax=Pontibacter sp. G13 TaxID=3074898 RepID=UPI00288AAD5B|nr:hypothetical protein [Pontibacter sp. G13]WNJ20053.1 hypothetical protein RJD25_06175 [Pontibacter sp. G13]
MNLLTSKPARLMGVGAIALLAIAAMLLTQCGPSSEQKLTVSIRKALRVSTDVDCATLETFTDLVASDPKLSQTYPDDEAIIQLIEELYADLLDKGRLSGDQPLRICEEAPESVVEGFDVYLENSGSMFGYFTGNTEFKDALMDLSVRMVRKNKEVGYHFVNDEVNSIEGEMSDFMAYLEPENKDRLKTMGNYRNTKLNQVVKLVMDAMVETQRPSVLVSDYIFSLENPTSKLSDQKYSLSVMINKHELVRKHDFGFLVIKCSSEFDGRYYDKNNEGRALKQARPYYIWIIGPQDFLVEMPKAFDLESLEGYEHHMILCKTQHTAKPYHSILLKTGKQGRFRALDQKMVPLLGIKDAEEPRSEDQLFQFAVAVDLSGVPVEDDYRENAEQYTLSSSGNAQFTLAGIEPIEDAAVHDFDQKKYLGPATHILFIQSDKAPKSPQELTVSLKKDLPQWVYDSSTEDDVRVGKDKNSPANERTFGFKYVIEGVSEAFEGVGNEKVNTYFELNFQIE